MSQWAKASLFLEDGSTFHGFSFGFQKSMSGEVVFNTGMIGYPETLTDPSYRGQILVLTYPLIGNYGVPDDSLDQGIQKHFESGRIQVQGLVVSEFSRGHSHWNAAKNLSEWLGEHETPAICGIDTRMLTKKLRERGTMLGKLIVGQNDIPMEDPNLRNLVAEVSIEKPIRYGHGTKTVLVIDCGCKNNILRSLLHRNVSVLRVPWNYDFLSEDVDGILISNGPGDPKSVTATIENVRKAMQKELPILGICLGCQILGLAAGADTYKLKYGHRSQNQPCMSTKSNRCYITSQNHGFAIDTRTLPVDWEPWFFNSNDNTNEGIRHKTKPFLATQFHPEASPGPEDTEFVFEEFLKQL